MQINITFTEAAVQYIKDKISQQPKNIGFRLSLKKTGCSGLTYQPMVIDEINPNDHVLHMDNGLQVFLDSKWIDYLKDLKIDYIEESKTGLKQKRLIYINPNEQGRCGCGESFHVASS